MQKPDKFCYHCLRPLREDARFCTICGSSVDQVASVPQTVALDLTANTEWDDMKRLISLYSVFFAASLILNWVFRFNKHPVVESCYWLVMTALSIWTSNKFKDEIIELYKVKFESFKVYLELFIVGVVTVFFLKFYFSLFDIFKIETVAYTDNIVKYNWPIWTAFFLTAICPGILEELVFRGVIYTRLKAMLGRNEALLIQAACFSVLHLMPLIFISHFVMGLFLGWVRERTNSLILCMILHTLWNAHIVYLELAK